MMAFLGLINAGATGGIFGVKKSVISLRCVFLLYLINTIINVATF